MAHLSVLLNEVLQALLPADSPPPRRLIDGTLGAGGHTRALLDSGVESALGLDLDPQALALARQTLADVQAAGRCHIVQGSYADMTEHARALGWQSGVDAILLDLGVSSMQLDTPERGFAFMHDGPLDMRFNPSGGGMTAEDMVNTWDADSLADVFYTYGEERDSRRLAQIIVRGRPFHSTRQLADAIKANTRPAKRDKHAPKAIHPATRVFQALRIAVNDELTVIERVLPDAIRLLRPRGRLAVISFHSLEDRLVKQCFKDASTEIISPPGMQLEEKRAQVQLITRKPITAQADEIALNPRSRSAKLRVVEKL